MSDPVVRFSCPKCKRDYLALARDLPENTPVDIYPCAILAGCECGYQGGGLSVSIVERVTTKGAVPTTVSVGLHPAVVADAIFRKSILDSVFVESESDAFHAQACPLVRFQIGTAKREPCSFGSGVRFSKDRWDGEHAMTCREAFEVYRKWHAGRDTDGYPECPVAEAEEILTKAGRRPMYDSVPCDGAEKYVGSTCVEDWLHTLAQVGRGCQQPECPTPFIAHAHLQGGAVLVPRMAATLYEPQYDLDPPPAKDGDKFKFEYQPRSETKSPADNIRAFGQPAAADPATCPHDQGRSRVYQKGVSGVRRESCSRCGNVFFDKINDPVAPPPTPVVSAGPSSPVPGSAAVLPDNGFISDGDGFRLIVGGIMQVCDLCRGPFSVTEPQARGHQYPPGRDYLVRGVCGHTAIMKVAVVAGAISVSVLRYLDEKQAADAGGRQPRATSDLRRGCARCRRVVFEPRSTCAGCGDRVTSFRPNPGEGIY